MNFILRTLIVFCLFSSAAMANEVGCVATTWKLVNSDKVCVESFKDPDIEGVACHISYAKTGGVSGMLGFAENPSQFSIACRQTGPIVMSKKLPEKQEKIFTQRMSLFFKNLNVTRLIDKPNNTLIYLVISEKIIEGSPTNSISSVPMMPWGNTAAIIK